MRRVSPVSVSVFQFTPLREGRQARRCLNSTAKYFNSRPSARGDAPDTHSTESSKGNFNSRPSARGDYDKAEEIVNVITFQFTPLREGRRAIVRRVL